MEALVWLPAWVLLWALPATLVNLRMATRHGRPAWTWVALGILTGWPSTLLLWHVSRTRPLPSPPIADPELTPDAARTPTWVVIRRWSDSTLITTEIFAVSSRPWRIHWKTSGPAGIFAGMFQILLYRENGTALANAYLPNTTQVGHATVAIDDGPGRFYLHINSAGFRWEVSVAELRPTSGA